MSSVRDFGARGDGRTDALEHAVRHVSDGLLEFPRGDFLIRRTIEVRLREHGRLSLSGLGGVGRVTMAGPAQDFSALSAKISNGYSALSPERAAFWDNLPVGLPARGSGGRWFASSLP